MVPACVRDTVGKRACGWARDGREAAQPSTRSSRICPMLDHIRWSGRLSFSRWDALVFPRLAGDRTAEHGVKQCVGSLAVFPTAPVRSSRNVRNAARLVCWRLAVGGRRGTAPRSPALGMMYEANRLSVQSKRMPRATAVGVHGHVRIALNCLFQIRNPQKGYQARWALLRRWIQVHVCRAARNAAHIQATMVL